MAEDLEGWDAGGDTPRKLGNMPSVRPPPMMAPDPVPPLGLDDVARLAFDVRETAKALDIAFLEVGDQSDIGACNGFAGAESVMYSRWLSGYDHVPLSGWWVYGNLCNGKDTGSNISDALGFLTRVGVCRDELVPYRQFDPRQFSDDARSDSHRYRIEIGRPLASFDDLVTASARREAFNCAVAVGGKFNDLDGDGVIMGAGQACNHAVSGGYGVKITRYRGPAVLLLNHWTPGWGDRGWFYLTRDVYRARWFDAYTIMAPQVDPEDPNQPPAV